MTKLWAALTPSTIDALVFLNRNATSVGIDPAKQLLRQDIDSEDPALSACRKVKEEMKEDVNISMPTDGAWSQMTIICQCYPHCSDVMTA